MGRNSTTNGPRRRNESAWQRFWRKYRMRSLRNSSDHAAYFAIGMLVLIVLLGAILYLGFKGAELPRSPGFRPSIGGNP